MYIYNVVLYEDGMEDGKICRICKDVNCSRKDPYILTKNEMIFVHEGNYIGKNESGEKVVIGFRIGFRKEEHWGEKPSVMTLQKTEN